MSRHKRVIETTPLSEIRPSEDERLREVAKRMLAALKAIRAHYDSFYGPLWDEVEEVILKAKEIL